MGLPAASRGAGAPGPLVGTGIASERIRTEHMIAFLAVCVAVLAVISLAFIARSGRRFSWIEFYLKGRSAGFSLPESKTLAAAAEAAGVGDLTSIFWSTRELDRTIAALIESRRKRSGREGPREGAAFMERVYAFRKKLELDQPRYHNGIRSSRQLGAGQRLRLLSPGLGVFGSTVIDNNSQFLVLSYPSGPRLPRDFLWKGKKLSLYFWRRDDAGYVFDSYVLDDLRIRNVPVIYVAHSESLLRTQKRKSIRSATQLPARLFLLKHLEGAFEKPEQGGGLRCLLKDVSEDGFAVLIGGRAAPGLLLKVQFTLGERQVVMSGTARSVDYDSEKNRSILHIEAVPPSARTRNAIRSYVYSSRAEASGEPARPQAQGRG